MFPDAMVTATDVSKDALELCQENIVALRLEQRVSCVESSWFRAVNGTYDLIVSNPPYLSDAELEDVAPELKKYEPAGALSSGPTGMESIEELLTDAPRFLNSGGTLYLETGCGQEAQILKFAESQSLPGKLECLKDLNQKHRFVRFCKD